MRKLPADLSANFSSEFIPRIFQPCLSRASGPPPPKIHAQNRQHSSLSSNFEPKTFSRRFSAYGGDQYLLPMNRGLRIISQFSGCRRCQVLIFAVGVECGENRGRTGGEAGENRGRTGGAQKNRGRTGCIWEENRGRTGGFWHSFAKSTGGEAGALGQEPGENRGEEFSLKQETQLGT